MLSIIFHMLYNTNNNFNDISCSYDKYIMIRLKYKYYITTIRS